MIYLYVFNIIMDYGHHSMSNHSDLRFSDEEVITIYMFGIIDGKKTFMNMLIGIYEIGFQSYQVILRSSNAARHGEASRSRVVRD